MERDDELGRIAADRHVPAEERVAVIRELARGVGPDVQDRAALWRGVLLPVLFDESDDDAVRVAAVREAEVLGGVVVNSLCRSTSPDNPAIRRAMVATLQAIGQRPLSAYMEGCLRKEMAELERELAVLPFANLTLSYGADRRILPLLHRGVEDPVADIRASGVLQLGRVGDLVPATRALTNDSEPSVRAVAAEAIGFYWTGEPEPIAALRDAIGDDDPRVQKNAKAALRRLRLTKAPTVKRRRRPATARPSSSEVDPRFPWSEFLHRWSLELCNDEAFALTQDDAVVEAGWTGAEPVTEQELRDLEHRIDRELPPSYRSFLKTTDGYVAGGSVERIRPAREVKPLIVEESEWVDVWTETASGGAPLTVAEHISAQGRDTVEARWQLLSDALQVSDTFDGAVYLLCPTIVGLDGEWEAWLFATWLPGAARFPSWWDLLDEEHRRWQTRTNTA